MKCVDMVKTHFPPMHEIGMEAFVPQSICDHEFAVCGATHPPTPPMIGLNWDLSPGQPYEPIPGAI